MLYAHHSQFGTAGPNSTHAPEPDSRFFCATCWRPFAFQSSGGTGYGRDESGGLHCYSCCDMRDVQRMAKRTGPFSCYLSRGGKAVSTWSGGTLGTVHGLSVSRTGWARSEIARFHVRDVHGSWWQARGAGTGMHCTLRPMRAPAYAAQWGRA